MAKGPHSRDPRDISDPMRRSLSSPRPTMPRDERGRYWIPGAFSDRVISRSTRSSYSRAQNSSRASNIPYPQPEAIIHRIDSSATWYAHAGNDLYLRDLVFQARMQTARRLCQGHSTLAPNVL